MNPVKVSTPSQTLFASVARGTLDSNARTTAAAKSATITHNRRARAAITISGRTASNLDSRIEFLQQAVFLRQLLGIERVLQRFNKRRQTALDYSSRIFPGVGHGEVPESAPSRLPIIQPTSKKKPRMRPQPNMADIT